MKKYVLSESMIFQLMVVVYTHTHTHTHTHTGTPSVTCLLIMGALVLRRGVLEERTGEGGSTLGSNNRDTWLGGDMQREGERESVCVCVCVMVSRHVGCVMWWVVSVTAATPFCPSSVLRKTKHQNLKVISDKDLTYLNMMFFI